MNASSAPISDASDVLNRSASRIEHLCMLPLLHADNCLLSAPPGASENTAAHVTRNRWPLIVALLAAPERESTRLAALLARWPASVRRHQIADDVARRLGGHIQTSQPHPGNRAPPFARAAPTAQPFSMEPRCPHA